MEVPDDDFLESIAPDVLKRLSQVRFFEKLDDRLCPGITGARAVKCAHDFSISKSLLREQGFGDEDVTEILEVLHSKGACCDCEILYNVSEENRLKAEHWKAEAAKLDRKTE